MVFFLLTVTLQDIQKFLVGHILCGNIQIQQIPGDRYPHGHLDPSADVQIGKSPGTLDFSQTQKGLHSLFQHLVHQFLVPIAVHFLFRVIPVREPLPHQKKNLLLPLDLPERLQGRLSLFLCIL